MISPLALIEEGATIGKNVSIAPHVFVSKDAVIGEGTTIAQGACIYGKTTIGAYNEIFSYAVLGSIPQDLKYAGEEVELIIGDHNKIREFTLFNPGTAGGGSVTRIGSHNLFMGYTHVGHDAQIGDYCILANAATLGGHVELGNRVVIGGLSGIHQFCKLGDFAMLGAGSLLTQDMPPYTLAEGGRAVLRGLNLNGLRRHIEDKESINALKVAYRELFEQGQPLQEVAQRLVQSPNEYVQKMAQFVVDTTRGIPFVRKEHTSETKSS
ncbi:MAG: UDP-N-acetylglucosamine acyltransferase [Sulfuricurvum sp. PC08-66]|nr:MAG: UDP-N-acetylglucosamine acyltransferase [Sulfuricurvum sp. PC08-66]